MKQSEVKNGRLPIFKERFRELQGDRTNTDFAETLGMSRQTVGFYLNGDRLPDAIGLSQIAKRCSVSSDWLIGLSDVKSPSVDFRSACEYSGLSAKAMRTIRAISLVANKNGSATFSRAMNELIAHEKFVALVESLQLCSFASRELETCLDMLEGRMRLDGVDCPSNHAELLEYAKKKWGGLSWSSGGRFYDHGYGFDVLKADRELGYEMFCAQNIALEIIKSIMNSNPVE